MFDVWQIWCECTMMTKRPSNIENLSDSKRFQPYCNGLVNLWKIGYVYDRVVGYIFRLPSSIYRTSEIKVNDINSQYVIHAT